VASIAHEVDDIDRENKPCALDITAVGIDRFLVLFQPLGFTLSLQL
jgi:hypothetical protein